MTKGRPMLSGGKHLSLRSLTRQMIPLSMLLGVIVTSLLSIFDRRCQWHSIICVLVQINCSFKCNELYIIIQKNISASHYFEQQMFIFNWNFTPPFDLWLIWLHYGTLWHCRIAIKFIKMLLNCIVYMYHIVHLHFKFFTFSRSNTPYFFSLSRRPLSSFFYVSHINPLLIQAESNWRAGAWTKATCCSFFFFSFISISSKPSLLRTSISMSIYHLSQIKV